MGLLDGQDGAHLRRRQRPLDRLGDRPGAPRRGRGGRLLVGREPHREAGPPAGRLDRLDLRRAVRRHRPTPTSRASSPAWGETHDSLDILVHALAFAKREDLEGAFVDTSRDGFALALDVSAYSLVALTRGGAAAPAAAARR